MFWLLISEMLKAQESKTISLLFLGNNIRTFTFIDPKYIFFWQHGSNIWNLMSG